MVQGRSGWGVMTPNLEKEDLMTNFVNLTPHALRFRVDAANMAAEPVATDIVVEPRKNGEGKPNPARVSATPGGPNGQADGVALFGRTIYGEVEGLPAPEADTIYIVSGMVAGRIVERDDVYCPGTGPKDNTVRTPEGQIYAVTRLVVAG